jgi:hypothetical protein
MRKKQEAEAISRKQETGSRKQEAGSRKQAGTLRSVQSGKRDG